MKNKKNMAKTEKIELSELQKLVKREIRNVIRRYGEVKTEEIIEDTGPTTNQWRE